MSSFELKRHERISIVTLLLSLAIWAFIRFRFWNFDDGMIVARMVRNILDGLGWRYNPDQALNASTSVLNTILISLVSLVTTASPPTSAHIVGTVSLVAVAWFTFQILASKGEALLSLALSSYLLYVLANNSTWGLETNLFFALLMGAIYLQSTQRSNGITQGMMILARPDGVLASGVLILCQMLRKQPWIRCLIGIALVLIPWFIFSWWQFSQLFPNSLSAKIWQGNSGLWGPGHVYLRGLKDYLRQLPLPLAVAIPFALFGFIRALRELHPVLALAVFTALQQLAYCYLNVPAYHWYFSVIPLAILVFAGFSISGLGARLFGAQGLRELFSPVAGISACIVLLSALRNPQSLSDARDQQYAQAMQEVEQAVSRLPQDTIAAVEVGTLGYHTSRNMLDLTGLTSQNPEFVSGKNTDLFFSDKLPRIFLAHEPLWHFERPIVDDVRFELFYEPLSTPLSAGAAMKAFVLKDPRPEASAEGIASALRQRLPEPQHREPGATPPSSDKTQCLLDLLNAQFIDNAHPGQVIVSKPLVIRARGWALDLSLEHIPQHTQLVLQHEQSQQMWAVPMQRLERADVAKHFAKPNLANAGVFAEAQALTLPLGFYKIWLEFEDEGLQSTCPLAVRLELRQ